MLNSSKIDYNILLLAGAALGGLYLWQKIKSTPSRASQVAAENYTSGTTGETISTATQPTIRTDLRQSARTERVQIRQDARTERQENRIELTKNILGNIGATLRKTTLQPAAKFVGWFN